MSGLVDWLLLRRPRARRRVSAMVRTSQTLYSQERHDESLKAAMDARTLAETVLGCTSRAYRNSNFHAAATLAAMRRHGEALELLRESDRLTRAAYGAASLRLIPILHATAEVLEAENKTGCLERAAEALREAKELRREAFGASHVDYAFGCFNEGGVLIRHANTALMMLDRQRVELATRGVDLILEASAVAGRAGQDEEQLEFLDATLELILKGGWPNRLASLAGCKDAIQRLRDAGGRDPEQEEEDEEEEEEDGTEAANDEPGATPGQTRQDRI